MKLVRKKKIPVAKKRPRRNWHAGCGKQNPSKGEKEFFKWHNFPSEGKTAIDLKPLSKELVVLGYATQLGYVSDKWNKGKDKEYVHDFDERDQPLLLYDTANKALLIIGGKMKVTADGLVG